MMTIGNRDNSPEEGGGYPGKTLTAGEIKVRRARPQNGNDLAPGDHLHGRNEQAA